MKDTAPTQDQAMCFYRAALSTARLIDRENEHRVLDADADAAWRAYGGDLPPVVRCDLVLRNLAMLYLAAFAPGPVFSLSGWYDDDPWGAGFERPPARMVEGLFAARATRLDREEALGAAAATDEGLLLDTAARERLLPLLQTMADLLPWVRQWHDEDGETASAFEAYLAEQARRLEVSLDEARAYRRPARAAGRPGARGRKPAPERAPAVEPRAPARAGRPARGASADEAALDAFVEAVRARDEGAGVAAADLGQQLGLSASALKKTVDALVEAGRLVEKKKRPRTVAYTTDGAGGGEGAGA
ncbi:hypothetical protein [Sorangium sp. So ce363]|uniref:hypothetical protein n=1 Tax=Sorangium sp. So ce363 TaxID=3133304 RepID=UPI003F636F1E